MFFEHAVRIRRSDTTGDVEKTLNIFINYHPLAVPILHIHIYIIIIHMIFLFQWATAKLRRYPAIKSSV